MKLKKFYDLISRTTEVTLVSEDLKETYFTGWTKDIPDEFDNCTVVDFSMNIDGDILFKIKAAA